MTKISKDDFISRAVADMKQRKAARILRGRKEASAAVADHILKAQKRTGRRR